MPPAIAAALPTIDARGEPHWVFVQRDWNQFFREFVADVRGEGYCGYPTFHDGWRACQIIEVIRDGGGWVTLAPMDALID